MWSLLKGKILFLFDEYILQVWIVILGLQVVYSHSSLWLSSVALKSRFTVKWHVAPNRPGMSALYKPVEAWRHSLPFAQCMLGYIWRLQWPWISRYKGWMSGHHSPSWQLYSFLLGQPFPQPRGCKVQLRQLFLVRCNLN